MAEHNTYKPIETLPRIADAQADVRALLDSLRLQSIRRYFGQSYWTEETRAAAEADQIEPGLKLENVAAHSWHVADAALLIGPRFSRLRLARVVELAVIHDRLELITGDRDPIGSDGQGNTSHAFNAQAQHSKFTEELRALGTYLQTLTSPVREYHQNLFLEMLYANSAEAQFVKSIDKLQALAFVIARKNGDMTNDHISFSIKYSLKSIEYFPFIRTHYSILLKILLSSIAVHRKRTIPTILSGLPPETSSLMEAHL